MYNIPKKKKKSGSKLWDGFPPLSKMGKMKLLTLLHLHPTYLRAIHPKFNITEDFSNDLIERRDGIIPRHSVIQIIGETGSGKSTSGIMIAIKWITKSLSNIKISMQQHELIKKAKTAGIGDVLVLDEQPRRHGMGAVREEYELTNLEEVTRKYKLSFIFISPSPRVHKAAHYWLRTIFMDTERRINRLAVIDPQTNHCLGHIEINIPKKIPLEKKYLEQKDNFIEQVIQGKTRGGYLKDYAETIMKMPEFELATNQKQKEIIIMQEFPTLTKSEVHFTREYIKLIDAGAIK